MLADTFELYPGAWKERSKVAIKRVLNYSPMLRFVLVDKAKRQFQTYRYCFLGSIDDWISIGKVDDLSRLVATYVRHLGEESYYDLY
jgi:hypothetical protein